MSSDEIDDSFSDSNFSEGGEASYASSEGSVKADSESDSPASDEEDDDDDDESDSERSEGQRRSNAVKSMQQRIFGFRYSPPDKKAAVAVTRNNSRKRKEPTPDPDTYEVEWISSKKRRVEPAPVSRANKIAPPRKPIELEEDSDDEIATLVSPIRPVKSDKQNDSPIKHDDSIDEDEIEAMVSPVKNRTRLRRLGSLEDITQEREDKLRQLHSMGFSDRGKATQALEHNDNNVDAAVDWLLAATRKSESEESSDEVQITSAPSAIRTRNGVVGAQKQEEKRARDEPAPVETELEKLIQKCEEYSKRLGHVMTAFMNESENSDANNSSTHMDQQPKMLQRDLKDYQLIGMNWLYTLHKEGLNGILADEMGLGKTIQTISLLALLKEKGIGGANLIVVPASTLSNWSNELEKWAPKLRVERYYGGQQERIGMQRRLLKKRAKRDDVSDSSVEEQSDDDEQVSPYCFDVMLTTYQTAFQKFDRAFLRKFDLSYLILDEAHNIKNKSSISFQALFKLNTQHRLLLTGTPLQNNLDELWALLYFIMPAMFGSFRNFQLVTAQFAKKTKRSTALSETDVIQRTKKILTPFILRRLKSTVSLGLKPKIEKVIKCQLTEMQQAHYKDLYKQSRTMWQKHIEGLSKKGKPHKSEDSDDEAEAEKNKKKKKTVNISVLLNNILMQLRKVANHPLMLRTQYTTDKLNGIAKQLKAREKDYKSEALVHIVEDLEAYSDFQLHELCLSYSYLKEYRLSNELLYNSSGKLLALKKLLKELFQAEHRVLIFSQMTKVLDILEHYVTHLDYKYLRLDGQTPVSERQEKIDQFNSDRSVFIFLLSTRAGGLGINLATADTAVFYDISFNPQVDRQAEDRCHRLGQEKQVRIFKFIAEGSIDEHMLKMAVEKKELNDVVLEEGEYDGNVRDSETDVLNDTREGVEGLFDVMFNSQPAEDNGHTSKTKESKSNGHDEQKKKVKQSTPNTSTASNEHNTSRGSDLFTLDGSLALSEDEDVVQLNDNSDDIVVLD